MDEAGARVPLKREKLPRSARESERNSFEFLKYLVKKVNYPSLKDGLAG